MPLKDIPARRPRRPGPERWHPGPGACWSCRGVIKMEQLDGQERPRVPCAVHVDSKGRRVEPQPKVTQRTVRNLRRRFGKPQKFFGAGS